MSFLINFTNQGQIQNPVQQLNSYDIAKEFCTIYYTNMISKGISGVLNLFDPNALCNYGGKEFIGVYSVMINLATDGISRMQYDKLNYSIVPIDNKSIIVQVVGSCRGVTFWNQFTTIHTFSELFVLKLNNENRIFITSYSQRLI